MVGDATVKLATLHNEDDIRRKDIRVGDTVIVQRAGEVIPQVVGPVLSQRTGAERVFEMPTQCPVCGTPVVRARGRGDALLPEPRLPGADLPRCSRTSPAAAPWTSKAWASRWRPAAAQRAGQRPGRHLLADAGELLGLERMGEKSAANLLDDIEGSKTRPLDRLLFGLGIRHVGDETAELLAGHFGSIDAMIAASLEDLGGAYRRSARDARRGSTSTSTTSRTWR